MRLALAVACLGGLAFAQAAWALDGGTRILVSATDRQMRSVVLQVAGKSSLPDATPDWRKHEVAVADARLRAFRAVRKALADEIGGRGADLAFAFLGEGGNATMGDMSPAAERAVADATVFVRRADVQTVGITAPGRRPSGGNGAYRVRAEVEVVYLLLPSPRGVVFARNAVQPLDMTAAGRKKASPLESFDFEGAYRALEKALLDKMRLEAAEGRLTPEGTASPAGRARTKAAPPISEPKAPLQPNSPTVSAP